MTNKSQLLEQIMLALKVVHGNAVKATQLAHEAATHGETVAENKYDTFGPEASYLAHGQAKRVAECEADITAYKKLNAQNFTHNMPVNLGALIYLKELSAKDSSAVKILFLGPAAGGLKLEFMSEIIMILSPSAPLGKALIGRLVGDEVQILLGSEEKLFEIIEIK